ncbi:hypothetical protein D3C85_1514440 [compost metagenome]
MCLILARIFASLISLLSSFMPVNTGAGMPNVLPLTIISAAIAISILAVPLLLINVPGGTVLT